MQLEDEIRIFHEPCPGIIVGELDDLHCAECGAAVTLTVTTHAPTRPEERRTEMLHKP